MAKKPVKKVAAKKAAFSPKVNPDTIYKTYEELKTFVAEMEEDVRKFADEGVAAAGKRLRASAQGIKKSMSQFRKDVITLVKANRDK